MRDLIASSSGYEKEARIRQLEAGKKGLEKQIDILSKALFSSQGTTRIVSAKIPTAKPLAGKEFLRVIIPDTHGSAIDEVASGAFISDLTKLDPAEIVLLGDHVDCGGFLAQNHVLGYVAQTDYSYHDDIASGNDFLDKVQVAAPHADIHYIEGNHERRVERWCVTQVLSNKKDCEMLRQAFAPEFLLHLKARGIRYYRQSEHYDGIRIPGAIRLGKCYFWHGVSTAKHAASVNIEQFAGNVVYGHTHREDHFSLRPVATGDIGAWSPGCLCKLQPLWCHTRPTNWTHGYAVQSVSPSGDFLHINIRIIDGRSLLVPLLL